MTPEFWITTLAIILGPLFAVLIAQWLQTRQIRRERMLLIFRTLMGTRRAPLSQERVAALNMIEIEFSGKKNVLDRFRELIAIYNDRPRWLSEDPTVRQSLGDDLDEISVRLINEISKVLGYKYDQIDILRGGYYPEAFAVQEEQNRTIREFVVGLREGRLLVPVAVLDYSAVQSQDDQVDMDAQQ